MHFVWETRMCWKLVTNLAPRFPNDFQRLCHKRNMIAVPTPQVSPGCRLKFLGSRVMYVTLWRRPPDHSEASMGPSPSTGNTDAVANWLNRRVRIVDIAERGRRGHQRHYGSSA